MMCCTVEGIVSSKIVLPEIHTPRLLYVPSCVGGCVGGYINYTTEALYLNVLPAVLLIIIGHCQCH